MLQFNCRYCNEKCIKAGRRNNKQRYKCKECGKYQQNTYFQKLESEIDIELIKKLNNVGLGIRSIAAIVEISATSVLRKLKQLSATITKPIYTETNQDYEIDELRTYVGNKSNECWIIYAINKTTKQVIDFAVGGRTKKNIKKVIDTVLQLSPNKIFTDKLNIYPALLKQVKHTTSQYKINYIERMNLNLRTHLKRLSRKTICYSKSQDVLTSCLTIYFWQTT